MRLSITATHVSEVTPVYVLFEVKVNKAIDCVVETFTAPIVANHI